MTFRTLIARLSGGALIVAAAAAAGCSEDPQATARKYIASGDAYADGGKHDEAIIEYRNALKATPNDAALRYRLGRAYENAGDPVKAYAEFARAADLDPSNVDAQMRAGTLLLVAREFEAARTRAELALKADPDHAPAHILLGNAMAGLNETASALRQIEQAISLDPSYAPAWTALGAVNFMGGRRKAAADAFDRAVQLAPRSVDARLALANYRWASGDTAAAEGTLKTALALEPHNESAHRALALLYVTTRRAPAAEPHFQALARNAAGKLALADYYMGLGRNADALAILGELEKTGDNNDARGARLRIAAIHYGSGKKDEAHRLVDALIEERPRYAEARTAKARMLLADGGSTTDALTHARAAVKAEPELPGTHYTLGLAAIAAKSPAEAERAFAEVARLTPRATAAQMQLARLRLARGESGGAVTAAEAAAAQRPQDPNAAVLLAQTLRAHGNLDRAARELTRRIAETPNSAPLHLEMGWLLLQKGEAAAARASFHEALRSDADSIDARSGIIAADLAQGRVDAARTQVAAWQKSHPQDTRIHILAAKVELASRNAALAEKILKEVITADATAVEAYELLGRTYVSLGKTQEAIQQYEALAGRSPSNASSARTMIGMLHEARQDRPAARAMYEQVVAADPRAGVAANNLAWIYAEEGKLDEALRLAQVAQDVLRRRPEAEDTLGWIYLQKGVPTQAIAAFERARDRAPQSPVYHYHAGLAYLKNGETERARDAFERALKLGSSFNGADDARAKLASIPDAVPATR